METNVDGVPVEPAHHHEPTEAEAREYHDREEKAKELKRLNEEKLSKLPPSILSERNKPNAADEKRDGATA